MGNSSENDQKIFVLI